MNIMIVKEGWIIDGVVCILGIMYEEVCKVDFILGLDEIYKVYLKFGEDFIVFNVWYFFEEYV